MNRKFIFVLVLGILLSLATTGFSTTFYIAATGSDSNNGTSKPTPWLHAPGMTGCTGVCASTTPQPGDRFILRGGDTWHYNAASGTPVGFTWTWSWGGSSGGCNLDARLGTVTKSSCIYVGTDATWYSSGAFSRPIMNFDNPLTTSYPASCVNNQNGLNLISISANNVIFDDFELVGFCWSGSGGKVFNTASNMVEMSNMYFHGWSMVAGSTDGFYMMGGGLPITSFELCDHNVFDGTDATEGNLPLNATGFAIDQNCTEVAYNIFHHLSNGLISNMQLLHDNLFEFMYEPNDTGTHGNIAEWDNPRYSSPVVLAFYNNIMHDTNMGEGVNFATITSGFYIFNNVSWLYRENSSHVNGTDGANCYQWSIQTSSTDYFFNNTTDNPCTYTGQTTGQTSNFQNNHFIGWTGSSLSNFYSCYPTACPLGTVNELGNEFWQSESVANGQGYTTTNGYAPISASSASVGKGANLTSFCNSIGIAPLMTACLGSVGSITYDTTNHVVVFVPGNPRPSSGAWDSGAYQFSSASQPAPATAIFAKLAKSCGWTGRPSQYPTSRECVEGEAIRQRCHPAVAAYKQ